MEFQAKAVERTGPRRRSINITQVIDEVRDVQSPSVIVSEETIDRLPHAEIRKEIQKNPLIPPFNEHIKRWGEEPDPAKSKTVAIITSGGDAPGMNAAVRSCVAMCLSKRAKVYSVLNGYKGLVEGGINISEMTWGQIANIMHKGGTVIGSARCQEFRTRPGRIQAAVNLANLGVDRLIVIGGDGSLTGAELFKTEWKGLLDEAVEKGMLAAELAKKHSYLCIVGMVGSIDNDMCGFSNTIGADTALHRIVDACDALITTAESHQRTFIVEVMGRNCGYLALMAAIAVGADWVFIPEHPPDVEDWETTMCNALEERRKQSNYVIVIVAEGATDRVRRPIGSEYLKSILSQRLGHDTRVTCLGHVQRGGAPSASDRIQATHVGAEAALAILAADDSTPSRVVGIRYDVPVQLGLTETVKITQDLGAALQARDFEGAMHRRGLLFRESFTSYMEIRHNTDVKCDGHRILLVHAGSPASGMNTVTKTMVRTLINRGHRVFGATDGFLGLAQGQVKELFWNTVSQWSGLGGCKLGTNRVQPDRINGVEGISRIATALKGFQIQALVCIGGFEAYRGLVRLCQSRDEFDALCIPMVTVPVTISNNIPGTDYSVGSDTALNSIVEAIDRLKVSASSSKSRLFIVEVMGGYCGHLAIMGALAGGCDAAYVHEDVVSLEVMQKDIAYLREKFSYKFKKAVIVRNENCSRMYNMKFMSAIFEQEGIRRNEQKFSVRTNVLGHLQQGNYTSPLDRVQAHRLGYDATNYILKQIDHYTVDGKLYANSKDTATLAAIDGHLIVYKPIEDLIPLTDFHRRRPKEQACTKMQPVVRLLELNNSNFWGSDLQYTAQAEIIPDEQILDEQNGDSCLSCADSDA